MSEGNERSDMTRMSEEQQNAAKGEKELSGAKKDVNKAGKEKANGKFKLRREHVVIGVLIIALAGVLIYFLWPRPEEDAIEPTIATGGRGTVVTQDNLDQIMSDLGEPPPAGHYIVTQSTNWNFDSWNTPGSAHVTNDPRNTHKVYFDLTLEDDGRLIYTSPYIPQGSTLRDFALSEAVPAGEHSAIITYFLVDDDDEYVTELSMRVTLNISK